MAIPTRKGMMKIVFLCVLSLGVASGIELEIYPKGQSVPELIWYVSANQTTTIQFVEQLKNLLEEYSTSRRDVSYVNCSPGKPHNSEEVCRVNMDRFNPCVLANNFFYNSEAGGPCLFMRLQPKIGWVPEYYDPAELPEEMPAFLKEHIRSFASGDNHETVWVTCQGEYPADIENIGPINYLPLYGFEGHYFPYTGNKGYLNPLIAIHFERVMRGIVISVSCRAWVKNIKESVVHFEILVD